MSVNSLYDAFVRAATAATISADILPLMGKLVTGLGVTTLPLTAARAERLPTTARLTANTTWPARRTQNHKSTALTETITPRSPHRN